MITAWLCNLTLAIVFQAGCSEEVVTVVAMLSVQSVWFAGNGLKALDGAKAK